MWRSYQSEVMRLIAQSLGAEKLPKFETLIADESTAPAMTQEQVMEQRRKLIDKLNAG